ncbi:hypothetical protein Tco_0363332 [Tanacetum coccineum]
MLNEKLVLVNDDGKPLKKVDPINADSDSEVEEVFNETAGFMALTNNNSKSGSGVGDKSLYEEWRETYIEDPYDDDDFADCDLSDAKLKLANAFDINLHGQLR